MKISSKIINGINKCFKKKIYLYTDSRGLNIPKHRDYMHYSEKLARKYHVDYHLCPEKWTTTLDFLEITKGVDLSQYEYVILHTGVVDSSPRHQRDALARIYPEKKNIFDETFGEESIWKYLNSDLGCDYEGDKTINLYSLDMAEECLLPRLKAIPNLIFINTNRIVEGWRGNYWRDRPANIALVEKYSELFTANLGVVIDLMGWSEFEIKKYTFDNIHPNKQGSDYIYKEILNIVEQGV